MYSFAAFGLLHTARDSVAAALALHNEALPFFHKRELRIERILTDYGHEFCGSPTHPYELYLGVYSIKHERVRVHHQHVNGFMERFTQIAQDEFFTPSLHDVDRFPSLSVLQKEFARWMTNYNTERSHLGYPLGGQRPWEVIAAYLASRPAAS